MTLKVVSNLSLKLVTRMTHTKERKIIKIIASKARGKIWDGNKHKETTLTYQT